MMRVTRRSRQASAGVGAAAGAPPLGQHRVRRTRAGAAWVGLVLAVLFLLALIIFIAQNGRRTQISFLDFQAHVATGLALLIAAVGGALVASLAGSVRIVQLRRIAHHHKQTDAQAPVNAGAPAVAVGEGAAVPAPAAAPTTGPYPD